MSNTAQIWKVAILFVFFPFSGVSQPCSVDKYREDVQLGINARNIEDFNTAVLGFKNAINCSVANSDTVRLLFAIDHLTYLYLLTQDYDQLLKTSSRQLALLKSKPNPSQIRKAWHRRATVYLAIGDDKKAFSQLDSLIIEAQRIGDSKLLAEAYSLQGSFSKKIGHYSNSKMYFRRARDIYSELNMERAVAITDYNLGIAYFYTAKYEESLSYFLKALSLCDSIGDNTTVNQVYNMMGILFEKQSYKDLALQYIQEGIANSPRDSRVAAHLTNNLGNIHLKYQDYPKADSAYDVAFHLWQTHNDSTEVVRTLLNKVQLAIVRQYSVKAILLEIERWWPTQPALWLQTERSLQMGLNLLKVKPTEAAEHLSEAIVGFRAMDATERLWLAISLQREAYLLLHDLEGFVQATQQYDSLQEVLFNKEQQGILAEMEAKYETEKKEQQLQFERLLNDRLVVFLVFLTAGLIVLVILWRRNVRKKEQLAAQKQVVEAQKKEIHHRAMNHFRLIQSYYALRADDENPEDGHAPGQISMMLESLIDLYDRLNVRELGNALVPFGEYMEPVHRSFADTLGLPNETMQMKGHHVLTYPDHLPYLGIIIIELFTNSVKYAIPEGDVLRLQVICEELTTGEIQLIVKDNGRYTSMDHEKEKSFGLQMIYLLAETQLKGKIEWKYEEGLSWCLTYPNKL